MIKSKKGIKPIEINIVNLGSTVEVEGGITLSEISEALSAELGFTPICARVNNKTEGLHYQVYGPKTVEFLNRRSDSGQRVYTRSLCMMLYHAVRTTYP
ncbi:MAG: nucleoside kinase, partial [Muribaculaceae bacterium]|nr:nucleoside kinase [Muribaculaceae bacterium]